MLTTIQETNVLTPRNLLGDLIDILSMSKLRMLDGEVLGILEEHDQAVDRIELGGYGDQS